MQDYGTVKSWQILLFAHFDIKRFIALYFLWLRMERLECLFNVSKKQIIYPYGAENAGNLTFQTRLVEAKRV